MTQNIPADEGGDGVRDCYSAFFFSSRRRHTRLQGDWSSDVCSSDLPKPVDFERLNATLQSIAETLPLPAPEENINSWPSNASAARISDPIAEVVFYQPRSEEHTSELQSPCNLVCRLLLEKKKTNQRVESQLRVVDLRELASVIDTLREKLY